MAVYAALMNAAYTAVFILIDCSIIKRENGIDNYKIILYDIYSCIVIFLF